MTIPLMIKKDDLLKKLRGMLPAAKKKDEKALAAHKKEEEAHLQKLKVVWKEALKWDYETAKKNRFDPRGRAGFYGPTCPPSETSRLEQLIFMVERTQMSKFSVKKFGKYHSIYLILTAGQPEVKELC